MEIRSACDWKRWCRRNSLVASVAFTKYNACRVDCAGGMSNSKPEFQFAPTWLLSASIVKIVRATESDAHARSILELECRWSGCHTNARAGSGGAWDDELFRGRNSPSFQSANFTNLVTRDRAWPRESHVLKGILAGEAK